MASVATLVVMNGLKLDVRAAETGTQSVVLGYKIKSSANWVPNMSDILEKSKNPDGTYDPVKFKERLIAAGGSAADITPITGTYDTATQKVVAEDPVKITNATTGGTPTFVLSPGTFTVEKGKVTDNSVGVFYYFEKDNEYTIIFAKIVNK